MDWQKYFDSLGFDPDDLLVVVDMQNDFVTGALGTKRAQEIVPGIVELVKFFPGRKDFTKDTHDENYLDTQEGRNLPILHTQIGKWGWDIVPTIKALITDRDLVIQKYGFGSTYFFESIQRCSYKRVWFVGLCTDKCVISNAVAAKVADPEIEVHIIEPLCGGVTKELHDNAINAMAALQMVIHR